LVVGLPVLLPLTTSAPCAAQTTAQPKAPKKKPKLKPAIARPHPVAEPEVVEPAETLDPAAAATDAASTAASSASAGSNADAVSCPQDRIDKLVHDLNDWSTALAENDRRLRADRGCGQPNVICLDRLGDPSPSQMPERVSAGHPLSVYAVVPSIDRGRVTISTSIRASTAQSQIADETEPSSKPEAKPAAIEPCKLMGYQKDAIKSAALPIAKFASLPGLEGVAVPPESWTDAYWASADDTKVLGEWLTWQSQPHPVPRFNALRTRIDVPPGDLLAIDFTRLERGSRAPSVEKHYEVIIDNGKYYVEPSLLVPFVYRGNRMVELTPTVSGTELRIGIEQDWHITGALMLNVFPFGRQKGQITSFRNCRYRSCIDNWLGAQFGASLDPFFQEWYLGVLFEPISGLGVGFGGALLKGEFLAPGRAEGMLLPSASAAVTHSDYMVRAYFGLSFTLDIFETLERGAAVTRRALF
jgi:hypothetical protein